jgi:hypothetical protein
MNMTTANTDAKLADHYRSKLADGIAMLRSRSAMLLNGSTHRTPATFAERVSAGSIEQAVNGYLESALIGEHIAAYVADIERQCKHDMTEDDARLILATYVSHIWGELMAETHSMQAPLSAFIEHCKRRAMREVASALSISDGTLLRTEAGAVNMLDTARNSRRASMLSPGMAELVKSHTARTYRLDVYSHSGDLLSSDELRSSAKPAAREEARKLLASRTLSHLSV